MLARNLLKAGDFVEPVPLGINVTLQYKPTGILERVWLGHINNENINSSIDIIESKELFSKIMKKSKVPTHVGTNKGSLFVQGVLYTGKCPNSIGLMPSGLYEELLDDIVNQDVAFNFFAGNVFSTSIKFAGPAQIRTWMHSQGFNILPGFLVPLSDPELAIRSQLKNTSFNYEFISGYFVFHKQSSKYINLDSKYDKIQNISIYLDKSGCVRCNISLYSNDTDISISYYEMVTKELYSDDYIILDASRNILTKYPISSNFVEYGGYTCPFCGKHYIVNDEFARCPDSHCVSRLYLDINHFLNKLNLPNIEYDRYIKLVDDKKFSDFQDILDIDELQDSIIETTFYDLLDAIIPMWAVHNRDSIWKLCSTCNNSWESINYYLENPLSISSDLKFDSDELVRWLQDSRNVNTINSILQYTNIVISPSVKRFEGSPIFRNKNIWITGKFFHGSNAEIESILRSYSAQVTDYDKANCGIIGGIHEGVDGFKVNKLRNKNIPIFDEIEFFNMYDIDSDLG